MPNSIPSATGTPLKPSGSNNYWRWIDNERICSQVLDIFSVGSSPPLPVVVSLPAGNGPRLCYLTTVKLKCCRFVFVLQDNSDVEKQLDKRSWASSISNTAKSDNMAGTRPADDANEWRRRRDGPDGTVLPARTYVRRPLPDLGPPPTHRSFAAV